MSGGSSAELGVIGHASIGTDEKTASTRAAWSQGSRWVGIARRLPSRSTNAIKTWIRNGVSHRRQRVAVQPIVRDNSVFDRHLGTECSDDSGYASGPTRPQSTKYGVEEPVANRAVGIPRSSCQDGAAKASTQVGYIKVGSGLFLTEVRISIGK